MSNLSYCRVWFDDPRLGCGWRAVIVLAIGRKWVRAVEPSTGIAARFEKDLLEDAVEIAAPRWRKLAAALDRARRRAKIDGGARVSPALLKLLAAEARALAETGSAAR